jgi:predicted NUDIX family phosphoesterase
LFSKDIGYHEAMLREVREEVAIEQVKETAVAVINDDSTDVGYVHFGVVHIMQVANQAAAGGRSGIVSPEFIPIADAVADASSYESWSRFCLENMNLLLAKATASGMPDLQRA